jgi:protein SCO1/2
MKNYIQIIAASIIFASILSCGGKSKKLPVMGQKTVVQRMEDGKAVYDSLDHKIPPFKFYNQEGKEITNETVAGKIYLADFFFTSCPTICPRVKANMMKVYDKYKDREDFLILSHSIDVKHDTIERLAWYANKMHIDVSTWHLLTGKKKEIYKIALAYLQTALESDDAPGGFDHSGYVNLIDREGRIRGMYDGTDPEKMDELIRDIAILYREQPSK